MPPGSAVPHCSSGGRLESEYQKLVPSGTAASSPAALAACSSGPVQCREPAKAASHAASAPATPTEPPRFQRPPLSPTSPAKVRGGASQVPSAHISPAPQVVLQSPHAIGSVRRSRQVPLQSVRPPSQVQSPMTQLRSAAHIIPQPPQCASSLRVSTQAPPQSVRPPSQSHDEAAQLRPAPHTTSQPPQCASSLVVSTHAPPQSTVPPSHSQTESAQLRPAPHATPQPPQCMSLELVSTHAPPQSVVVPPHESSQPPSMHTRPASHVTPQPPQFAGSLPVSTHAPSQSVVPPSQAQAPPPQLLIAPHATSQSPQCASSLVVSTHSSPQRVSPAGHAHAPSVQLRPAGQATSQPPQFESSELVSTHAPPHSVSPSSHAHAPASQVWSERHAASQSPQCSPSTWVSTQSSPHAVWPSGQLLSQRPATHISSPTQVVPHAPQFASSLARSTQLPPQLRRVAGQETSHAPSTQTSSTPQETPQLPQFETLALVSTQLPPQSSRGGVHESTQAPISQTSSMPQTVPQAPQFAGSSASVTQRSAHSSEPEGQGGSSVGQPRRITKTKGRTRRMVEGYQPNARVEASGRARYASGMRRTAVVALFVLTASCGDDDVGVEDAGLEDAGREDAGHDATTDDGGALDASVDEDATPVCSEVDWERCVYPIAESDDLEVEGFIVEDPPFRRRFPVLVRYPAEGEGPLPVVLASHGGTFNEMGHRLLGPWGRTLARAGYAVVHMAHRIPAEADLPRFCMALGVPMASCNFDDFSPQVAAKAIDAVAVLDSAEALSAWFEDQTGRTLDLSRVGTVGWSGGSQTGMTLLGAVRYLDDAQTVTFTMRDERVVGALALSVQGPGFSGYFDEGVDGTSMDAVTTPLLIGTGDNDYKAEANPELTPAVRRQTYENLPGADGQQWLFYSQLPLEVGGHETHHLDDLRHPDERVVRASLALQSVGRAFMDAVLRELPEGAEYLASGDAVVLAGEAELLAR